MKRITKAALLFKFRRAVLMAWESPSTLRAYRLARREYADAKLMGEVTL